MVCSKAQFQARFWTSHQAIEAMMRARHPSIAQLRFLIRRASLRTAVVTVSTSPLIRVSMATPKISERSSRLCRSG